MTLLPSPRRSGCSQPRLLPFARRWCSAATLACTLALSSAPALDLANATIADLNAAMAAGTLTSEKLLQAYLARVQAYEDAGPNLNAFITLNPKALDEARALDAERQRGRVRGPLHGIPVVLKDNVDTFDLPTTAGSQLLEGHVAPDDAFIVKRMRDAGAIILGKANLSEFAGGGGSVGGAREVAVLKAGAVPNGSSSIGGQTLNPHDLSRGPAGSSGGTGAAIAAVFAQFGIGTDTGGSVRGPTAANGLAGLKPTIGLLSRDGIVPLALTFDTAGPMARSVYDIAVSLNVMAGVDRADEATRAARGKIARDYTTFLKSGSLRGARIGVARDFTGKNEKTDRVFNESVATLQRLGAEVIEVRFPEYLLNGRLGISALIMASEFKAQIADYLKTTGPQYPKTLDDIITRAHDPQTGYRAPEKAFALKWQAENRALDLTDPIYLAAKNQGLALTKATVEGLFQRHRLDAMVYPTGTRPAALIRPTSDPQPVGPTDSATNIANQTGFPDLIVPAGMTSDGLPVTLSFFGLPWSEGKLLGYGFDFEQATKALRLPKTTPALATDRL